MVKNVTSHENCGVTDELMVQHLVCDCASADKVGSLSFVRSVIFMIAIVMHHPSLRFDKYGACHKSCV